MIRAKPERTCRICGCTEEHACETVCGACYWVEYDLCSACAKDKAHDKKTFSVTVSISGNNLERLETIADIMEKTPAWLIEDLLQLNLGTYIEAREAWIDEHSDVI
ncbi:MAG: hypothetical protein WDA05_04945 [Candidatus Methanomethylophilaceae archaeon]